VYFFSQREREKAKGKDIVIRIHYYNNRTPEANILSLSLLSVW